MTKFLAQPLKTSLGLTLETSPGRVNQFSNTLCPSFCQE